jgi:hypothetical protein
MGKKDKAEKAGGDDYTIQPEKATPKLDTSKVCT